MLALAGCGGLSLRPPASRIESVVVVTAATSFPEREPVGCFARLLLSQPPGTRLDALPSPGFKMTWTEVAHWVFPVFQGRHPGGTYFRSNLLANGRDQLRFYVAVEGDVGEEDLGLLWGRSGSEARLNDAIAYLYKAK